MHSWPRKLQRKGLKMLDAPVTGGDYGARSGTLSILVGGAKEDYDACLDLFSSMAQKHHLVQIRPAADSMPSWLIKSCKAGIMSGVCETMSYVKEKGLDPEVFMEGAAAGAGQNALLQAYGHGSLKVSLDRDSSSTFLLKI